MLYSLEDLVACSCWGIKTHRHSWTCFNFIFKHWYDVSHDVWCLLRSIQDFFQLKKVDSNPEIIHALSSLKRKPLIHVICDCLKILIQIMIKPRFIVFKFGNCHYLIKERYISISFGSALLYPFLKCPKN